MCDFGREGKRFRAEPLEDPFELKPEPEPEQEEPVKEPAGKVDSAP